MPFRFIDHTADIAVEVTAESAVALFRDALRAWLAIVLDVDASPAPSGGEEREVTLRAESGEALLVDFLNELIFLFDSRGFLASDLRARVLRLDAGHARLDGVLVGETYDPARHVARSEVKAATFHDMMLERGPEGLRTTVVFDL